MNKQPNRERILDDKEAREFLKKRTRRSFLTAGVAAAAAIGGYEWMQSRSRDNGTPWP
jgi:hypothetical protein